jgi:uncharacterized protein (UPF0218 family)
VRDKKIEAARKQTLVLTREQRKELKNPIGALVIGPPSDTMRELAAVVQNEEPVLVISVGDEVSRNMMKYGIKPHVMIIDNKIMREETKPIETQGFNIAEVENPAGTLTPNAWRAVQQALSNTQPTRILVDGEEDLLTLVTILEAPEGSLVVYGQPREGIVVTRVDKHTKQRVSRIVDAMKPSTKLK